MSDPDQPSGSGNQYRNIRINEGAKAQLGDIYHIGREDPLSRLPFATHALFNSYDDQHEPACIPGTRVDLLQEIYNWGDGKDEQDERCIFWLNGLAGTGKSTISRTVARRYNEQKRLGASFFFSKGGGDVSHARKFFTTLAVQLAKTIPSLQKQIYDAIAEQSNIANLSLFDQWRQLVVDPLLRLGKSHQSYVLVVDALDECEGDNDIRKILELLAEARSLKTVRLRVFLTSRSEIPIRHGIHHIPQADHQDFILQNIPPAIINHDISLFLEYTLGTTRQEWTLGAAWPGDIVLRQLVLHACGLFIWAATACRFINEGEEFAEGRLVEILEGTGSEGTPEQHLDQIYLTVLQGSIPNTFRAPEKVQLYARQRKILGSIAILLSPLPAASLAKVISISTTQVMQTLERLQAILDVPKDVAGFLRLHHPSFRDFLLNRDRCRDFWVDEKGAHQILAAGCVQLMYQTLKKDICEMNAPGSQASEVDSSWIEKCLPPEVQYACLYWVQHLQRGGSQVHSDEEAHRFLQAHLLHWFEALGWMGKASEGIQAIMSLEAHILVDKSPNLHAFIHDAKRFALSNRLLIEQAPLQLYCSALVFAPENSIVRRQFEKCIPPWMQTKLKVQADWSAALQTLEGHTDLVTSVAFSHDRRQLASGSRDRTVRIWDADTGALQQVLEGHSQVVNAIAFSPNGRWLASASDDGTVRLWNTEVGTLRHVLEGHFEKVDAVALSPDGQQLVSASANGTVKLWDVETGSLKQSREERNDEICSIAFSPDGLRLASASTNYLVSTDGSDNSDDSVIWDSTITLWDAEMEIIQQMHAVSSVTTLMFSLDGRQLASGTWDGPIDLWDADTGVLQQTFEGHTDQVHSITFYSDRRRLASGSHDSTVRIWDAETGMLQQILVGHTAPVLSVTISLDGRQLASGSGDATVRIWDTELRPLQQTLEGHTDWVNSITFAPHGRRLASCSRDANPRIWDAETGVPQKVLKGHTNWVTSIMFSPNGLMLASGSCDNTVRIWDSETGALLWTLRGHTKGIHSIKFSFDGRRLASGSADQTVRVWDTNTGILQQTLTGYTSAVYSVTFSSDGRRLSSGSYDSTVWIWDIEMGALQWRLKGHTQEVNSVTFSSDGRWLGSSSKDQTVRIWDIETGVLQHTLEIGSFLTELSFSSNDLCLITDLGSITLGQFSPLPIQTPNWLGYCLSSDRSWITWNGNRVLWLPTEYRPKCSMIKEQTIAIGCASGQILFFDFNPNVLPI